MSAHDFNVRFATETNLEVTIHGFVVQEVLLDHVAAVSEAEDELAHPVVGVHLHDVPQNGTATDLHHRFGAEFGLLPETSTQSTAQNYNLHIWVPGSAVGTGQRFESFDDFAALIA
jgi:hypothetical protein